MSEQFFLPVTTGRTTCSCIHAAPYLMMGGSAMLLMLIWPSTPPPPTLREREEKAGQGEARRVSTTQGDEQRSDEQRGAIAAYRPSSSQRMTSWNASKSSGRVPPTSLGYSTPWIPALYAFSCSSTG